MIKIELTKEQLDALIQILQNTQIRGSDAEFIVELKRVLGEALMGEEKD